MIDVDDLVATRPTVNAIIRAASDEHGPEAIFASLESVGISPDAVRALCFAMCGEERMVEVLTGDKDAMAHVQDVLRAFLAGVIAGRDERARGDVA